ESRDHTGISPGLFREGSNGMEKAVSFSGFRFELETGRLWSGTREIRLTLKASAVLKKLVTHAGQPVSKDDLFASVWSDTAVSDDALTSCVQELRKALEDDAKQPRFIETRHRRGYQFVARGDIERSADLFRKASEVRQEDFRARSSSASLCACSGE